MGKVITPPDDGDDFGFEVIGDGEIRKARRGRKANPETERLARGLATVTPGTAVRITSLRVDPTDARAKARNSAVIRSAAKAAGRKVSIWWDPVSGVPQAEVTA